MPTLVDDYTREEAIGHDNLRSMPQTFAMPGWATEPITVGEDPIAVHAGFAVAPVRVFTLPDPTVGGFQELREYDGRTVDPGFSPHSWHAPFVGQGHYDAVPTWNQETVEGEGTPNLHGFALRQGVITQLAGYQPPEAVSALAYVAALSATRTDEGIGGLA